ncbi:hypothetical protein HPB47_008478 [Ixodes persulcatus]|uniref:Uncharacterized protein n=1 Tax=Ixodes persulcatus TaxID=34615 RepID=A0AC60P4N4_IXOPE|nr:hypothetical protein HPB47_008478 [Ixodes persulcatus]
MWLVPRRSGGPAGWLACALRAADLLEENSGRVSRSTVRRRADIAAGVPSRTAPADWEEKDDAGGAIYGGGNTNLNKDPVPTERRYKNCRRVAAKARVWERHLQTAMRNALDHQPHLDPASACSGEEREDAFCRAMYESR